MEEYKIEKGIPVGGKYRAGSWMGLAEKMSEGDSVLMDEVRKARGLAYAIKKLGGLSAVRKCDDDNYRVWRLEEKGE